jgi:integrase
MTQAEVLRVMAGLAGTHLLVVSILYGCGLRLMECVHLRLLDVDFDRGLLYVR